MRFFLRNSTFFFRNDTGIFELERDLSSRIITKRSTDRQIAAASVPL